MTRAEFDKRFRRAKYSILALLVFTLLVVISSFAMGGVSWWLLSVAIVPVVLLYDVLSTKCASCSKPLDQIAQLKGKASKTTEIGDLSTLDTCPHCDEAFFDPPRKANEQAGE